MNIHIDIHTRGYSFYTLFTRCTSASYVLKSVLHEASLHLHLTLVSFSTFTILSQRQAQKLHAAGESDYVLADSLKATNALLLHHETQNVEIVKEVTTVREPCSS